MGALRIYLPQFSGKLFISFSELFIMFLNKMKNISNFVRFPLYYIYKINSCFIKIFTLNLANIFQTHVYYVYCFKTHIKSTNKCTKLLSGASYNKKYFKIHYKHLKIH